MSVGDFILGNTNDQNVLALEWAAVDNQLVVNNDGDHSMVELSGQQPLAAGTHEIRIEFFDSLGRAILDLDVEGPDLKRQPIPFSRLSH